MTLDGFRAWAASEKYPERGKVTYFDGRLLLDMSPEYFDRHVSIKRELTFIIESIVRAGDLGEVYPDGSWLTQSQAKVSNEPDVMFAYWDTLSSGKLTLIPSKKKSPDDDGIELRGTPDWVCEIVSDSSVEKDTVVLREAYFRAGIPEYWLLDARGDEIDFKLLVAEAEGYGEAPATADGWRRSPVFDREFHISRDRDRVGRFRYKLAHR